MRLFSLLFVLLVVLSRIYTRQLCRSIFEKLQANVSKKSLQCNDFSDFEKSVNKLQILARFLLGFCLEILKILSRLTKLACVTSALEIKMVQIQREEKFCVGIYLFTSLMRMGIMGVQVSKGYKNNNVCLQVRTIRISFRNSFSHIPGIFKPFYPRIT